MYPDISTARILVQSLLAPDLNLHQPAFLKRLRGLISGSSKQHDHGSKSCTISFPKCRPHLSPTEATRKIDWCNFSSCSKSIEGLYTLLECQRTTCLIPTRYLSVRGGRSCEWANLNLATYLHTMAASHMVCVCVLLSYPPTLKSCPNDIPNIICMIKDNHLYQLSTTEHPKMTCVPWPCWPMRNFLDVVDQKEDICFPLGIRILVVAYLSRHTIS